MSRFKVGDQVRWLPGKTSNTWQNITLTGFSLGSWDGEDEKDGVGAFCDHELEFVKTPSAFATQVCGNHYTKYAIQPMQYSMANGLDALQHSVVKYVTRFRDKNGIEDLRKAIDCLNMLIEHEETKA